ncbi:hypothetical protein EPO17_01555 [Patescibacteria group bacterium]|nr:MAG: hypothetical protein EPO17_01555 [Patescibacteria group bacterium]
MSTSCYVNYVGHLPEVLKRRRSDKYSVRLSVDAFIDKKYGISDFTALVHSHLPTSVQEAIASNVESVGVLARQVPGICAEDVAMYLLCRKLGLFPLALSFTRDTFVAVSHDKRHRVKVPWVRWSKSTNLIVEYEDISARSINCIERQRLDKIVVNGGGFLPQYHEQVRHHVFNGSYPMGDASKLHGELLARATRARPDAVYRTDARDGERLVRGSYTEDEARTLVVRPPSEWYYPLYLSMFMDGSLVLLDTYENSDGGVPEAKALFEKTMRQIADGCGWMPLVIQTAPLCLDMMFCNRHLLSVPNATETLCERARLWHSTTYDASRHFADMAIMFRG